jgi:protoporphyrinogen oxidase
VFECDVRNLSLPVKADLLVPFFPPCRFELSDTLGGRVSSISIEGHLIEMGASIIHSENRLVIKMAEAANLTLAHPQGSEAGLFALFDGTRVVFRQSPWRIITLIKLLWSYGLQPWYYKTTAAAFLQQFLQVYDFMNQGIAFLSPYDLLRKLELFNLTQQSFGQFIMDTYGLYSRFAAEFVAAASKVNYNQENFQLNALAGLVSLLPAADSRLFTIKEGNQELINRTLTAADAHVHLNTAVVSIAALDNGQFEVGRIPLLSADQGNSSNSSPELYDAVVIAAPLTDPVAAAESISGVKLPFIPQRDYQTTVVTVVKGAVRPTFFGLPPGRMPYGKCPTVKLVNLLAMQRSAGFHFF